MHECQVGPKEKAKEPTPEERRAAEAAAFKAQAKTLSGDAFYFPITVKWLVRSASPVEEKNASLLCCPFLEPAPEHDWQARAWSVGVVSQLCSPETAGWRWQRSVRSQHTVLPPLI